MTPCGILPSNNGMMNNGSSFSSTPVPSSVQPTTMNSNGLFSTNNGRTSAPSSVQQTAINANGFHFTNNGLSAAPSSAQPTTSFAALSSFPAPSNGSSVAPLSVAPPNHASPEGSALAHGVHSTSRDGLYAPPGFGNIHVDLTDYFDAGSHILMLQRKELRDGEKQAAYITRGSLVAAGQLSIKAKHCSDKKTELAKKAKQALEAYHLYWECYNATLTAEKHYETLMQLDQDLPISNKFLTMEEIGLMNKGVDWKYTYLPKIRTTVGIKSFDDILDIPTKTMIHQILEYAKAGGLEKNIHFTEAMNGLKQKGLFGPKHDVSRLYTHEALSKESLAVILGCALGLDMAQERDEGHPGCVFVKRNSGDGSCWVKEENLEAATQVNDQKTNGCLE